MENTQARFDIFSGKIDKDAMWIESVEGLSSARERMEQIATEKPGQYFLFSAANHSVLAQIETFDHPSGASKAKGSAA